MATFNSITFNPDTDTLTVKENGTIVHAFNLTTAAVKLKVTRCDSGQFKLDAETGRLSNFSSDRLECKIKYDAMTTLPSIIFDVPESDVYVKVNNTVHKLATQGQLHALFIGSDDIRHNKLGSQTFKMEGDIISLGIDGKRNMLVVGYHDSISPNV